MYGWLADYAGSQPSPYGLYDEVYKKKTVTKPVGQSVTVQFLILQRTERMCSTNVTLFS
jgi:hypothetical protein